MGNYFPAKDAWMTLDSEGRKSQILKKFELDRFNPDILGLGDITLPSQAISAVAAVFDLEGFTKFCSQIDPEFSVPNYLNRFLSWLLDQIKKETVKKEFATGSELWHSLPFFAKFMGDGLLVLWDARTLTQVHLQNLIVSLHMVCKKYPTQLLTQVKYTTVNPPCALRCGVARGTVYSVGDSADYVGSCINMAARLQKLPGLTFAFNRRGFYLENPGRNRYIIENFAVKLVSIRGISDGELICVLESDLAEMNPADKVLYAAP